MAGKTSLTGKLLCFFEEMEIFCFQYHGYVEMMEVVDGGEVGWGEGAGV